MSTARAPSVMPGCQPWSHAGGSPIGVLVVHGFTGTPASMRGVADAMATAGFDVELPRLPGHGTTVQDMITTGWADWADEVARARAALAERCDRIVLVGQSMGATLVLASSIADPAIDGLVCINPVTRMRTREELEMIDDLLADDFQIVPGEGSDIADPEGFDISYDGTPLRPLRSLLHEGIAPIEHRFGGLRAPLRLFTSRQDHVVPPADSEYLAATYGGDVEHTWLERSYHVATRDHDRELVAGETVAFVERVAR
ncbi:MAG TPA: alpha/beta fold hydrolase [Ilumatobacter sp.]|nr:alpha/beta fold hydrolase [Ilumatobacter sp.]